MALAWAGAGHHRVCSGVVICQERQGFMARTERDIHLAFMHPVAVVSLFIGLSIGMAKVAEPIIQTTIARFPTISG
eukprot:1159971-Pelagomonas_calceolata.AAC.8